MAKERVQRLVVGLVVILLVASALGYLLVPSAMLGIVGMESDPQVTFLVRTLAAALLALSPGAWAARRREHTSAQRSVLVGLAGYLFASSLVDLYGFVNQLVGVAAVPSIILRVLLGAVLVWLIPARTGLRP
jgi:cation transport ATPase